jgi:hypothetical protein
MPQASGRAYAAINFTLPRFQMDDKFGSENKAKIEMQQSKPIKSNEILIVAVFHSRLISSP